MLTKEQVSEVVSEFGKGEKDSGNTGVQIALLNTRIKELTEHLKDNKKDNHSRMGMYRMLGRQRKLLKYLKNSNLEEYRNVIAKLKLKDRV